MVKNDWQNRLKTEKLPFLTKFKAFGDQFFKNEISAQLPKSPFKMSCAVVILISVKISFWHLLVLYVNFSVKPLNLLQNGQFPIFSLFLRPFLLP